MHNPQDQKVSLQSSKVKTAEEISSLIGGFPRKRKVIMCHGNFDVVHPGHIRHLYYAKSKADILVASLTADVHIRKGNHRPYVPEDLRAFNLAALELVDFVVIDRDPTPINNLSIIKPDFFAKGYEYTSGGVHAKTQEEIDVLNTYGGQVIFTPGDIVFSSTNIIETSPPSIGPEKLDAVMRMEGISFDDIRRTLKNIAGKKVLVVGDTIVDTYTHCSMVGGMTKTPTMSVKRERVKSFVGGAGIVSKHLVAAGADVTFISVLGDDPLKHFVLQDIQSSGVSADCIIDDSRPTTEKNAIVVQDYRLLKVDTVDNTPISDKVLSQLVNKIKNYKGDAVAFCDFRHGIFNKSTVPELSSAIPENLFKVADSQVASRWGNILEFQGFDLITPNEREARFALGDQDSVIRPLASELYSRANCKTLILKCGDKGSITFRSNPPAEHRAFFSLDSFAGLVKDPVGAGDALLAYSMVSMLASGNEVISSIVGAIAAGVLCEIDGNHPVRPEKVLARIDALEERLNFSTQ